MVRPAYSLRTAFVALALGLGAVVAAGGDRLALATPGDPVVSIPDSLRGLSGKLRARIVPPPADTFDVAEPVATLFGGEASRRPDVWMVRDSATNATFAFITLVRFAEKRDGRVGNFFVGRYPAEVRSPRNERYLPPAGFIEVTEANAGLLVSEHFALRDFLDTKQAAVWPKALVLDERLVDKLELIIEELRARGHRGARIRVMSGFRTPMTAPGRPRSRRTPDSRHQHGDAADIIVDADGDQRMDDLTGDGRLDLRDTRALIDVIKAVEERHPTLIGGIGMYRNPGISGPFLHVDARGESVRWGLP